ncbi:MAG: DegT/DnrJ/EryC1/StrS family aminotransferase, partial [Thermodesulfobacteriota bacterium]
MKKMHVPMLDLKQEYAFMKTKIDAALKTCLDHQRWIFGPEVGYLEERVARYLGIKHCIGVSSGTDALTLALRALAIKTKGTEYFSSEDEIITTPFTFTATGDAIIRAGATPVFVDIDIESYNINVEEVNAYISSQPSNVVGIVPVHLYGLSCGVDKIMRIARSSDLFVVEDAAQAFGATEANKHLGAIGTAGAFSFFPSKNLGAFGDGGMVATEDGDVAEIISMLLRHGG